MMAVTELVMVEAVEVLAIRVEIKAMLAEEVMTASDGRSGGDCDWR